MSHPDLQLSRIQRDEVDIQSLVDLMDTSWINALSPDQAECLLLLLLHQMLQKVLLKLTVRGGCIPGFQEKKSGGKSTHYTVP